MSDRLEFLPCTLDEALGKIDAASEVMQMTLRGCDESDAAFTPVRQDMCMVERIVSVVVAIEMAIVGREGVAV